MHNSLDHISIASLEVLQKKLAFFGCTSALIKKLVKNNNDKNQVYFHHDATLLNSIFDLRFETREKSTSKKKSGKFQGKKIQSAVFNSFNWVDVDNNLHRVEHCKGILYHQYPEVRLSGFKSESGLMPCSMSVEYTKLNPSQVRYLVIGATSDGKAYSIMAVSPESGFAEEFKDLEFAGNSKICKVLPISESTPGEKLKGLLIERIGGKDVKGCRMTPCGETVPFTGTQVHGYTLEHELGIGSNSDKGGDFLGIELKCFTNKKLTLFTPEPDGGLYAESFDQFMSKYGYAKEAVYRFTGLHRVGKVSEKTSLELEVVCIPKGAEDTDLKNYDIEKPISHQLNGLQVVLSDEEGVVAASWSSDRLLNNWGVKHNEAVYVPATVRDNDDSEEVENGYLKRVIFGEEVLWCRRTSLEKMIQAIAKGVIFLDPAPKFDPDNPKNNKRRSQWRINNIYRDSKYLYSSVENVTITA